MKSLNKKQLEEYREISTKLHTRQEEEKRRKSVAFCWLNGQIGFGAHVPDGALPFARAEREADLRAFLAEVAEHDRYSDDLLIPGIRGFAVYMEKGTLHVDSEAAYEKLKAFCNMIHDIAQRRGIEVYG